MMKMEASHGHEPRKGQRTQLIMPENLDFYKTLRKVGNNKLLIPESIERRPDSDKSVETDVRVKTELHQDWE